MQIGALVEPLGIPVAALGIVVGIEIQKNVRARAFIAPTGQRRSAKQVRVGNAGSEGQLQRRVLSAVVFELKLFVVMLAGGEPYTTDPCQCQQIHDTDVAACVASAVACDLKCTTIALGAIAACLAAGPFMPACMILILAAEVACLGACVASLHACKLRAQSARLRCLQTCVEARP